MTKIVYSYSKINGEYTGETVADESPLEEGVYLIPAYATEIAPIEAGENQACIFSDGEWSLVDDYRGTTYYDSEGNSYEIDSVGVVIPDDCTTEPPEEEEKTYTDEEILLLRAAAYADSTTGSDRLFIEYQALLAQDLTDEAEEVKTAWLARRAEIKEEYPLSTDEEEADVVEEVETTEEVEEVEEAEEAEVEEAETTEDSSDEP